MDRLIVYPGQIPLDTDELTTNKNAMVALAMLSQATLGTSQVVDGLACTPTTPFNPSKGTTSADCSVVCFPGSTI